jgi:ubiquinone/menaquinone biosynthesis C-methylase UbiE
MTVFDQYAQEYDRWFDDNERIVQSEVNALKHFVPKSGRGIEIGAGTGRFSIPLAITLGVEPSKAMTRIARQRGLRICQAKGEQLPFSKEQFDFVLLVTVICFVTDMFVLLREIHRVLAPGGLLINGFIDQDSALGCEYETHKDQNKFYRSARFYSTGQIAETTCQAGFGGLSCKQTIIGIPGITPDFDQIKDGSGEGAFVALSARKLSNG